MGGAAFIDAAFHEYFHAVQGSYCHPTLALSTDPPNGQGQCMALGYASPFFVEGEADFFARSRSRCEDLELRSFASFASWVTDKKCRRAGVSDRHR